MIIIVGGNSSLTNSLLQAFGNENKFVLFSRKPPELPIEFKRVVAYQNTDYVDSKIAVENCLNFNDGKLVVVWVATPFPRQLMVNLDTKDQEDAIRTGVQYPVAVTTGLIPKMMEARFGRFVFIGSSLAKMGDQGSGIYTIVKGAQKALSRAIAVEYGRFGITSNVLDIGPLEDGLAEGLPESRIKEYRERTPSRQFTQRSDIANLAKFLVANQSINGAVIDVDAGMR